MGKMSEMNACIKELHDCAETLTDIAYFLFNTFSHDPEPAKTDKPKRTLESVRAILAEASRAGHTAEIRGLLQKYGAPKLSEIDPGHYEALVADVEGLTNG